MISIIIVMMMNTLIRAIFVAGACYLADGHPVMAAFCIVGAFLCGYNCTIGEKK